MRVMPGSGYRSPARHARTRPPRRTRPGSGSVTPTATPSSVGGPVRWRAVRRATAILVAAIGAAGIAARFTPASPLWLDEALSVNLASLGLADLPDALRHDGHPILYYALLGLWIDLIGDGDQAVRWLSGLFSAAAVPVMWAAARRRMGPVPAAYTALLAAASPFLIRYGSEARMYALVTLIAALGWWATEAALENPSRWRLAGVAAAVAAGLHTHYWMIWLTTGTAAVLVIGGIRRPERRRALGVDPGRRSRREPHLRGLARGVRRSAPPHRHPRGPSGPARPRWRWRRWRPSAAAPGSSRFCWA